MEITVNMTPSVGVVMRTKNRSVLLRRAIESVCHQSYQNWQLVIVNDGGNAADVDRLVAHLLEAQCAGKYHVIHHPESKGMEAASNAGISHLDTELAVIHDDDDSWSPEFLSVLTKKLSEKQKEFSSIRGIVSFINTVHETVEGNRIQIDKVEPWIQGTPLKEGFVSLEKMLVINQFPPIAFLFDLKVCKDLGMFDESLPVLGDWNFHSKFMFENDIWVHPEYLAFYHLRLSAGGVLGNSIISGRSKHQLYAEFLSNNWLRQAIRKDPSVRFGLAISAKTQDGLNSNFGLIREQVEWRSNRLEGHINSRTSVLCRLKAAIRQFI